MEFWGALFKGVRITFKGALLFSVYGMLILNKYLVHFVPLFTKTLTITIFFSGIL